MVAKHYSATDAAKILGCSRSSVCRAARNNDIGIFANGRLAALSTDHLSAIKSHIHETPGNPMWIAARGQKLKKRKEKTRAL
jgi:hypothetical protein